MCDISLKYQWPAVSHCRPPMSFPAKSSRGGFSHRAASLMSLLLALTSSLVFILPLLQDWAGHFPGHGPPELPSSYRGGVGFVAVVWICSTPTQVPSIPNSYNNPLTLLLLPIIIISSSQHSTAQQPHTHNNIRERETGGRCREVSQNIFSSPSEEEGRAWAPAPLTNQPTNQQRNSRTQVKLVPTAAVVVA
jgi:hypothetical protein